MSNKKTFIGFDLGDGESITDYVTMDVDDNTGEYQTHFNMMTMPGSSEPGRAVPTTYAYDSADRLVFAKSMTMMPDLVHDVHVNFKRKPSDLLPKISDERKVELLRVLEKTTVWPSEIPELNTEACINFMKAIVTFTNAVFENEAYMNVVRSEAADSTEIVFCVGHPTKWDDLDVYLYKAILYSSILGKGEYAGKKSSLVMAAESRAAYLTIKDKTTSAVLPKGTSALLIDVGSSTIDLTCVSADSHNYQFNSGNNYLGARGIDYLIKEMYLNKLKEGKGKYELYQDLVKQNPEFDKVVTLACRLAKEDMYSGGIGMGMVSLGDFAPVRIMQTEVDIAVGKKPLAPVLQKNIGLPAVEQKNMGTADWISLFNRFLAEQKQEINRSGIRVGRIILTGSASKMPFVSNIVKEVFSELPEGGILADMNPSRSISMGLALVGPSNEKSLAFQKDLNELLDIKLAEIISDDLPALAEKVSTIMSQIIARIMRDNMKKWRAGKITTLNAMSSTIERECSGGNLENILKNNAEYQAAVKSWITETVGQDLATELQKICKKYHVNDFSIDDLNIMKTPTVKVKTDKINPVIDMTEIVGNLVAIVMGIITACSVTTIMAVITAILLEISVSIAATLFGWLMGMGPVGWGTLATILGIGVAVLIRHGVNTAKDMFMDKVRDLNLPLSPINTRGILTDNKIEQEINKADLKSTIKNAILSEDNKNQIIQQVLFSMKQKIEKKAEDIKYVIESK